MERVAESAKQHEPSPAMAGHGRAASPAAASLPPALELQQLAGNQAMQELLRSGFLQPKLAISSPDDPEEREADNVANTIMRKAAGAPCSCSPGEEMCEECQQKQSTPSIQRRASAPSAPSHVPRIVSDVLRSPGHPLDSATRAFFEPRFGRDFSDVRVHTGSEAAASARSIHAHAYTAGSHIAFDSGQYSPDSTSGRTLLAHELTHVVSGSRAQARLHRQAAPQGPGEADQTPEMTQPPADDTFWEKWSSQITKFERMFNEFRYGCWCGPGHVCDEEKDAIDSCCKEHDFAYAAEGIDTGGAGLVPVAPAKVNKVGMWSLEGLIRTLPVDVRLVDCLLDTLSDTSLYYPASVAYRKAAVEIFRFRSEVLAPAAQRLSKVLPITPPPKKTLSSATPPKTPDNVPAGERAGTLHLPPQKTVHRRLYQALIKARRLVHRIEYERETNAQAPKWDRTLRKGGANEISLGVFREAERLGIVHERLFRPNWSRDKDPLDMTVDHIVELQLTSPGETELWDSVGNYELLDAASNSSSGSALKASIWRERVERRDATGDDAYLTAPLRFVEVVEESGDQGERWEIDEIQRGDHIEAWKKHRGEIPEGRHTIMRKVAGAPCSCSPGEEVCEECQQKQSPPTILRRASAPAAPAHVPRIVGDVLRSPGHPLDAATRAFFEPRFGRDFSDVRTHTGPEAAESTHSINALAYTAGSDIVFGSGQYSPDTMSGRTLLAHELTHVVQQPRSRATVSRKTEGYETEGIPLSTESMEDWASRGFWEQRLPFKIGMHQRMIDDPEERNAVLSVIDQVQPHLPLHVESTQFVTIPKRGAPSSKDLLYKLIFRPQPKGEKFPLVLAVFVAEGSAAKVIAASDPGPGFTLDWPATMTAAGFPEVHGKDGTKNFLEFWNHHPQEKLQVLNFVRTVGTAAFDQVITTSVSRTDHRRTVTDEFTFQVIGTKDRSGAVTALTVRLLTAGVPTQHVPPTDYASKDFSDLEIEQARLQKDPKKHDTLGAIHGLDRVPSPERLSVKYAIWQYFRSGTRNAEVDAIVPIASSHVRVLYTLRFQQTSNDVDVERIGEEGKGVSLSPPLRLQHVNGFADHSTPLPKLKSWLQTRYPGLPPHGANPTEVTNNANAQIQADSGKPTWFTNNYGIEILVASAASARLKDKHSMKEPQLADLMDFTAGELKVLESVLETMTDFIVGTFKGISMVRQRVAINPVPKHPGIYQHKTKEGGVTLRNLAGDRTIIIFDQAGVNDARLFLGGKEPAGGPIVEPSSAEAFAHELGHLVSFGPGVQDAFDAFIKKKGIHPPTAYATGKPETETFPEFFALFQLDPQWMKANSPELFDWFVELTTKGAPPKASP